MNINISKVKISVTVPLENAAEIRQVLADAGTGVIGNYSHCSTSIKAIGTFKGNDSTKPYVGEKNKFETVAEEKIEVQCDINIVREVLKKLREAHPYEEPAIEIIPLLNEEDL